MVTSNFLDIPQKLSPLTTLYVFDLGTNVFTQAEFKFYLSAQVEVRAERRYQQMLELGKTGIDREEVLKNLIKRDQLDMSRKHAPLLKSKDAIDVDTTDLSVNELVELITKTINKE